MVMSRWRWSASIGCYLNAYVPNLQVGGQVKRFLDGASRQPDPVAGDDREDRQPVPSRGEGVRRGQPDPDAGVEEAGSQPVG